MAIGERGRQFMEKVAEDIRATTGLSPYGFGRALEDYEMMEKSPHHPLYGSNLGLNFDQHLRGARSVERTMETLTLMQDHEVLSNLFDFREIRQLSFEDLIGRDVVLTLYYPSHGYVEIYLQVKSSQFGIDKFKSQVEKKLYKKLSPKKKRKITPWEIEQQLMQDRIIIVNGQQDIKNIQDTILNGVNQIASYHELNELSF